MMRFILPSILFLEAHAVCREKFATKEVAFPDWQAVLADPTTAVDTWDEVSSAFVNTPNFTAADVPGVISLIYAFWGGVYGAAFSPASWTTITEEEKKTQSYVTLFPNQPGCIATNCAAEAAAAAKLQLAGQSYALGKCTKFMFNGNPLSIIVGMDATDGECKLGVYTGHSCDALGTTVETPKKQASGTCDDFPLDQGFKMKVHCVQDDGSSPASYREPETSFLQKLMHLGTCVPENRTQYPCDVPATNPPATNPGSNNTNPGSNNTDGSGSGSGSDTSGSVIIVGASSVLALLALF